MAELVALENEVAGWVPHFRKEGKPFLADMIQKWLSGDDSTLHVDENWLRRLKDIQKAEGRVEAHFRNWVTGKLVPKNSRSEIIHPEIENLKVGQALRRSSRWDATFTLSAFKPFSDAGMTINRTSLSGHGDFRFIKLRGGVEFSGRVGFKWSDDFDWDKGKAMRVPTRQLFPDQSLVHPLKNFGRARDFDMKSNWSKTVRGRMRLVDGSWKIVSIQWK